MQTKEQVEAEFRKDFQAMLDKYGAEIKIEWDWCYYLMVTVPSLYDANNNLERECTKIDFGREI